MPNQLARVQLKPREERRIRNGHLWIYSNEIDTAATPLKQFQAGELVKIITARDEAIAIGFTTTAIAAPAYRVMLKIKKC